MGDGGSDEAGAAQVIYVEDDPYVRRSLVRLLARDYRVADFESGEPALAYMAERGPPGVLVVDLRLGEEGGLDVLRAVSERHTETVGLVVTGHPDLPSAVSSINEARVFAYLVKPVEVDELRRVVADAMTEHLARVEGAAVRRRLAGAAAGRERAVRVEELCESMVLLADIRTLDGTLLAQRGVELTEELVARLQKVKRGRGVKEPFMVLDARGADAS